MKLEFTIEELELLLKQQKEKVIDSLMSSTYMYNTESTEGNLKSLPIDKEKMREVGMEASYPRDFKILKRHAPKQQR